MRKLLNSCSAYVSASPSTSSGRKSRSQKAVEADSSHQIIDEHHDWQLTSTQADSDTLPADASGIHTGTTYYIPKFNDLPQDLTGCGLFDSSILQSDLTGLSGQALVDSYKNLFEASKIYLRHMVTLRLTAIQEGILVGPALHSTIQKDLSKDFTQYLENNDELADYSAAVQALGSQNRLLDDLEEYVKDLRRKLQKSDQDNQALRAVKKEMKQFENDVVEISNWTRPGSLSQIHSLIRLYGFKHAKRFIDWESDNAFQLAARLS